MKKFSLKMTALIAAMMMSVTVQGQALNDSLSKDTAMWFNQTQELSGVVVKGRLPKTRVKGEPERYWKRPEP